MQKITLILSLVLLVSCSKSNDFTTSFGLKHRKIDSGALRQGQGTLLEYYITLVINGREHEFIADTGSSNLVLPNLNTSGLNAAGNLFQILYGGGFPSGTTVTVQNYAKAPLILPSLNGSHPVTAGSITNCQTGNRGCTPTIAGLAYARITAPSEGASFVDELLSSATLSDEFSTLLCGIEHDDKSKIVFGGVDAFVTGLQYTPIKEKSWYTLNAISASINGNFVGNFPGYPYPSGGTPCADSGTAGICTILDSGTTISAIPRAMHTSMIEKIQASNTNLPKSVNFWAGTQELACSSVRLTGLPNIVLHFENNLQLSIRPESYMKSTQKDLCIFGFSPTDSSFIILGQAVMENQYIHFDRKNKRVGFTDGFQACGNLQ